MRQPAGRRAGARGCGRGRQGGRVGARSRRAADRRGALRLATLLGPLHQLRRPGSGGRAVLNVETRVVFTDSLPKNPSGKLLKRELRLRELRLRYAA